MNINNKSLLPPLCWWWRSPPPWWPGPGGCSCSDGTSCSLLTWTCSLLSRDSNEGPHEAAIIQPLSVLRIYQSSCGPWTFVWSSTTVPCSSCGGLGAGARASSFKMMKLQSTRAGVWCSQGRSVPGSGHNVEQQVTCHVSWFCSRGLLCGVDFNYEAGHVWCLLASQLHAKELNWNFQYLIRIKQLIVNYTILPYMYIQMMTFHRIKSSKSV